MFANTFPDDKLNAWQYTQFQTWLAIECYTCYLTEKRLVPQEPNIKFDMLVDPHNVLWDLAGPDFFHSWDNHVEYRELSVKDGKNQYASIPHPELWFPHSHGNRYIPINPPSLRVSDIIEVQLAFVNIPVQDQQFKAMIALHGIALLNNAFYNMSDLDMESNRNCDSPQLWNRMLSCQGWFLTWKTPPQRYLNGRQCTSRRAEEG